MIQKSNTLSVDALKELAYIDSMPGVSIYLPTCKSGRETMQGHIHLKNLLKEVEDELVELGLRSDKIEELTGQAHALVKDLNFWQNQDDGLALFMAEGMFRAYMLPINVPVMQSVSDSFHITPLLPLMTNDGHFYIMAVSENDVRLFDATRYNFNEVHIEGVPKSMSEALWADDKEKQLQSHSGGGASSSGDSPMFFGNGDGAGMEQHKADFKRYFDKVDAALAPTFKQNPAPVVLAGVSYLLPIYRSANTSANILEEEIHGNKDRESASDLHHAAWNVAQPYFATAESNAKALFPQLLASGTASDVPNEIIAAAEGGRVATLFISTEKAGEQGARFDVKTLNHAAIETLRKGGIVYALAPEAMPSDLSMTAIYRY